MAERDCIDDPGSPPAIKSWQAHKIELPSPTRYGTAISGAFAAGPRARQPDIGQKATATPYERSVYASPAKFNIWAMALAILILIVVLAPLLFGLHTYAPVGKRAVPLAVELRSLPAPPEQKKPEKPKTEPEQEKKRQEPQTRPAAQIAIPLPAAPPPIPVFQPASAPMLLPRQPEAETPGRLEEPPSPQSSGKGPDSWEGRVFARLLRFRRYPGRERALGHEGTAVVRFRLNRSGRVLSVSLVRSSGHPELDRAAIDTVRRADPLPRIPKDRSDEVDLDVPIAFFIRPSSK